MSNIKSINCPTCQKEVIWTEESEHRPFCSERCKLIDFGEWANEKKSIAGESVYSGEVDDQESLQ